MGPEVWVVMGAVFVCGGAVGAAGTLLAQWVVRKVSRPAALLRKADPGELELLKAEISEMGRYVRNLDARLDFTEQLLGGAVPTTSHPPRLEDPESGDDVAAGPDHAEARPE